MVKIVRTKSKATGGITAREQALMADHAKLWIDRAMRTDPIEPSKIVPAIEGIYAAAGLKKPRVVIVPSPLVLAFAYGASAAIWHVRKTGQDDATYAATYAATRATTRAATYDATRAATYAATDDATRAATDAATYAATDVATRAATDVATRAATDVATRAATYAATYDATYAATYDATYAVTYDAECSAASACRDLAGQLGIECAKLWYRPYQGGNMWAGYDCYLTACRDILGLELSSHDAYAHWEQAAIHGAFRVMHEEFCMVSDFPEIIRKDEENRPHCEDGPSHQWRDGWSLYHWHGTRIPAEWIEDRDSLTPQIALTWENVDQRAAACEILGWHHIINSLDARVLDKDADPQIGRLVEIDLPDHGPQKFIHATCGTGREVAVMADARATTVLEAQAASYGLSADSFLIPEIRT